MELRTLRQRNGLTLDELGRLCELTPATISRAERGLLRLAPATLERLLAAARSHRGRRIVERVEPRRATTKPRAPSTARTVRGIAIEESALR